MNLSNVNIGTGPSAGDGDPIRTAFGIVNNNFAYIQSNINSLTNSVTTVAGRTGNVILTVNDIVGLSNAYAISSATTTANTGMRGYVDTTVAANIAALINGAPGALDTLEELAYALGNNASYAATITNSLASTNSNITLANTAMRGYVDGQISAANSVPNTANIGMKGYVDNAVSTANLGIKGYIDQANTIQSAQITTANLGIKGYIDQANTIQSAQMTAANLGIIGYINSQVTAANVAWQANSLTQSVLINSLNTAFVNLAANAEVQQGAIYELQINGGGGGSSNYSNINVAAYLATQGISSANIGMKGYVDSVANRSIYGNSNVKSYFTGGFDGNIIPSANVTYSLGTPTRQWKDLYVSNNTIYISGTPLSSTPGGLTFAGAPVSSFAPTSATTVTPGTVWNFANTVRASSQLVFPAYGSGKFVIVESGTYGGVIWPNIGMYSTDGSTWTTMYLPNVATQVQTIAYGAGKFVVAYGSGPGPGDGPVAYSTDGINWTLKSNAIPYVEYTGSPGTNNCTWTKTGAAYGNGRFVLLSSVGARTVISTDGITWSNGSAYGDSTGSFGSRNPLPLVDGQGYSLYWQSLTFDNGWFLASAYRQSGTGANVFAYSSDGINWTRTQLSTGAAPGYTGSYLLGSGGGVFIAIPASGTIGLRSTDNGRTWSNINIPSAYTYTSVTYGGGAFILTPSGGAGTYPGSGAGNANVALSTDGGITWSSVPTPYNAYYGGGAYGAGTFIAAGNWYGNVLNVSYSNSVGALTLAPTLPGTIDRVDIGTSTPGAGAFTSLSADSISTSGDISAAGNITVLTFLKGLPGGNLTISSPTVVTGNVTANYFVGNGSLLTALPGYAYSNVNVAAYVTTANSAVIGYIDQANSIQSAQITAANVAWQANATAQQQLIYDLQANAITQQGLIANLGAVDVTTLSSAIGIHTGQITALSTNAATQSDLIIGINSNVSVLQGNITTLFANAATQSDLIIGINANVVIANLVLKGYVDLANTIQSAQISAANIGIKGYVDQANTIQSGQVGAANLAITAANVGMKGYVDQQMSLSNVGAANTGMRGYVDNTISSNISPLQANITTLFANAAAQGANISSLLSSSGSLLGTIGESNTGLKGYVDLANTIQSNQISAANLGMKGYVDNQITTITGGAPAILNTLGELANALGSDANLSVTLTSYIANVNANISTANVGMKGYVDSQSFYSNTKVATYLQAGNISNVSVAGNVTATYFIGNGSQLTGIIAGSNYSNVQVATYLPTYSGNIANVRLGSSGVLTFPDGTAMTTAATGGGSNYGNANVTAYTVTMGFTNFSNVNVAAYVTTSNSAIIGYIDQANTIQSAQVNAANLAIISANVGMKGYVDSVATLSSYGNSNVTAYTVTMGFTNYSNVNVAALITTNGLTNYSNANVQSFVTTNGLTNYSNVNVAAYLGTGQITVANVKLAPSGNIQFADGTAQTSAYSNVNLIANLRGSITVGNITILGALNTTLNIGNSFIGLATDNTSNTNDIGFYGQYSVGQGNVFTGLAYTATDGMYRLFSNLTPEPGTTINQASIRYSNIQVGNILAANVTVNSVIASNVYVNGNITAVNINGNSFGATANYTGNVLSTGLSVFGNTTHGTVGAVSGQFHSFVGNITQTSSGGAVYFNTAGNLMVGGNTALAGNLTIGTVGTPSGVFHTIVGNITQVTSGGANVYFNTTGNISASFGNFGSGNVAGFAIGYRDVPQITAANVTLIASDAGKHYYGSNTNPVTLTIPLNSSVAFGNGTAISLVNQGTGNITIANIAGVQLYLAGNATGGSRTLTSYGMATLLKVQVNTWFINGTGVV